MSLDALRTAYARTILHFGGATPVAIDLSRALHDDQRHTLRQLGLGATFAIVTASNPGGRTVSDDDNRRAHATLRGALTNRGHSFVPAAGASPDESYREEGFAVAIDRAEAVALAGELAQLAIYWFDGDAFWLDDVSGTRAPARLPR